MKGFIKGFVDWWQRLAHELGEMIKGGAEFLYEEPLSALLALALVACTVMTLVVQSGPARAALLLLATLLFTMFKHRAGVVGI